MSLLRIFRAAPWRALAVASTLSSVALCAPAAAAPTAGENTAQQCLADLRKFDKTLNSDGYWLDGTGYGYGYPMVGYGYRYDYGYGDGAGDPAAGPEPTAADDNYWRARPGYEVRTLLASARILAQRGQQQACETLLGVTRQAYATYAAELKSGKLPRSDAGGWRRQQIAGALPVSREGVAYRSDELIGASVINGDDKSLGSVEDIVMSPRSGKIAFLVIRHGGVLGFGKKYSPVPWSDFKATSGANLLVLEVGKDQFDAAPEVREDQFAPHGDFAAQRDKVNAYWAAYAPKP
jgi:sporulation protein YlmC with PRC-barrel domain